MYLLQYDNVLMEESAQILEVETFIPLMLQVTSYTYVLSLVISYCEHHRILRMATIS